MPFMTRIPSDLARYGLKVETVPGWQTRGSSSFNPGGVTCHWTAGPRNATGRPSLNVVTNGRSGLPGPLCNVYLDRQGVCVVVAAGRANHAGVGGYRGLVGNSAVYGIEAEAGGDRDWTPAQSKAYPRLVAALLSGIGRGAEWAHGHNEWAPTRKIDIRDWPMPAMRGAVAALLSDPSLGTPGGFLMALTDAEQAEVLQRLRGDTSRGYDMLQSIERMCERIEYRVRGTHDSMDSFQVIQWMIGQLAAAAPADVDEEALAAALAGAIPDNIAERVAQNLADRLAA